MAKNKVRLDQLMVQRGLAETRSKAQALILAGSVRVAGDARTKAGELIAVDAEVEVAEALPYASRGGYKLAHALDAFALDPAGNVALDVGASTGGFTHVLLQRGAARVYAVDVGYGQLDWRLRQDPRVVVVERTNIRYLEALPMPDEGRRTKDDREATDDRRPTTDDRKTAKSPIPNLHPSITLDNPQAENSELKTQNSELAQCATIDVSFISLRLVLPAVQRLIASQAWVVALIKPQFEAGADQVGKGGVVRDPAVHTAVLRDVLGFAASIGLAPHGLARSPITGPAGNVEFLAWLGGAGPVLDVERAIRDVLA
jgi:23S rRNA (cytidine1920-2'-O)/16S rRNA (cytidine1409-2'-O)-methyltransferase